jgi:L-threonylcarbamoyladenylate synthase
VGLVLRLTGKESADAPLFAQAADILRGGGLVAFPTETVYGLGANALSSSAVDRIFRAKGRPSNNPIIVHVSDVAQAKTITLDWSATAERLAQHFWPGPLTLVLPKAPTIPSNVTAGGATVAVRCPAHQVAQALISAAGLPIAAPSANRSGHVSATTADHVQTDLGEEIDCILDGGAVLHGIESTVLDCTVYPPVILRPGPITAEDLEKVGLMTSGITQTSDDVTFKSPGLLPRHYAPRCRLLIVQSADLQKAISEVTEQPIVLLHRPSERVQGILESIERVQMPEKPQEYAKVLYGTLRSLEERVAVIVIHELPHGPEWEAINDRLRRASKD